MALYLLNESNIESVPATDFCFEGIKERQDLQRLLKRQIEIIDPDLMVVAEEFGEWEDSHRRIDLLCLDRDARLVVVELKRTADGGHMELQAIRYAAMISTMTFDDVLSAHEKFLAAQGRKEAAKERIFEFLGWEEIQEADFANDARIILVSAAFSKEITSAVLWLNDHMIDIRCIRIKPYQFNGSVLVDIDQIIPLPEAGEYQVKIREKAQKKKQSQHKTIDQDTFWQELETNCSPASFQLAKEIYEWIGKRTSKVFMTADGFANLLNRKNYQHYLFKLNKRGGLQIWFQYMSQRPPFGNEDLRNQLRKRLNEIDGVDISEEKLKGKPSFPIAVLEAEAGFSKFKDAIEWAIQEIDQCPEA